MKTAIQVLVFNLLCCAWGDLRALDLAKGPYLGQEPPGLAAKVFAPGFISLASRHESFICFAPDGKECYFTEHQADWAPYWIMMTLCRDGEWTPPQRASFTNNESLCTDISSDGTRLFFGRNAGVYQCLRTAEGGWSAPVEMDPQISSGQMEFSCHLSDKGNLFVCSWRAGGLGGCDGWRIPCVNGQWQQAENLRALNSSVGDCGFAPGPKEGYLVFQSRRPPSGGGGGFFGTDLLISFASPAGGWTAPRNLGPAINSPATDGFPWISHDGKYLFFSSDRQGTDDIYWVSVNAFLPDPNGPVLNLSTGQRFAGVQAAINFAESGQVIVLSPGTYRENLVLPNTPLTIRSANAQDSAVVALTSAVGNGNAPVVTLSAGTALRSIQGLTITGGTDGVTCSGACLRLSSCVITGHQDCGIEVSEESTLSMDHCIVAGNTRAGLRSLPKTTARGQIKLSKVDITQCTLFQNQGYALEGDGITVANSILCGNGGSVGGVQIKGNNVQVSYSDVQGGFAGQGNLDADPAFVASGTWTDPNIYILGDCHLRSQASHWNSRTNTWVLDDATSPCIDKGDPNAIFGVEPAPNGGRVNLGAYGNTTEASRSPSK